MRLLALDTSSVACSVALADGETIVERHEEQPREHTRILLPMIRTVLAAGRLTVEELDAVVLGNGPGSFIGLRIAASVAQGLAYGAGIRIVPVSSLAIVAAQVFGEHDAAEVVVAQDAHMNEVYLGIFRQDAQGGIIEQSAERLAQKAAIAELDAPARGRRVAAGFGWERYPELLDSNRSRLDALVPVQHVRARFALALAAARLENSTGIEPRDVAPAYLRQTVAQKPARPT